MQYTSYNYTGAIRLQKEFIMARNNVLRKQKVYELIKRYIPSKGKVLDVSCGNGEILDWLRQDGYSVRGTNYTKHPDACNRGKGVKSFILAIFLEPFQ